MAACGHPPVSTALILSAGKAPAAPRGWEELCHVTSMRVDRPRQAEALTVAGQELRILLGENVIRHHANGVPPTNAGDVPQVERGVAPHGTATAGTSPEETDKGTV